MIFSVEEYLTLRNDFREAVEVKFELIMCPLEISPLCSIVQWAKKSQLDVLMEHRKSHIKSFFYFHCWFGEDEAKYNAKVLTSLVRCIQPLFHGSLLSMCMVPTTVLGFHHAFDWNPSKKRLKNDLMAVVSLYPFTVSTVCAFSA